MRPICHARTKTATITAALNSVARRSCDDVARTELEHPDDRVRERGGRRRQLELATAGEHDEDLLLRGVRVRGCARVARCQHDVLDARLVAPEGDAHVTHDALTRLRVRRTRLDRVHVHDVRRPRLQLPDLGRACVGFACPRVILGRATRGPAGPEPGDARAEGMAC